MQINSAIPMAGVSPNLLAAYAGGQEMGQQQIERTNVNALNSYVQQNAPGIMGGDQNALAGMAGLGTAGLQASLGVQESQLGMQNTQSQMADREARLNLAYQQAAQQAQLQTAQLSAAQREQERAETERAIAMGTQVQTPEQWDALMMQEGQQELVGQFEQRDVIIAGLLGVKDALGMNAGPTPQSPEGKFAADQAAGLIPEGVTRGGEGGAAEQAIQRMMSIGIPRDVAIRIKDGVYNTSRDPVTGEVVVVDLESGALVFRVNAESGQPEGTSTTPVQPAQPDQTTMQPPAEGLSFGGSFQGAGNSFGVQGFGRNLANTVGDVTGLGVPFPEDQQTRQDFEVLGETLLNDFASAYGRQPPSWLLQQIKDLMPNAGSVFEGPQRAQTKLNSIAADMQARRQTAVETLNRRLTPQESQETRALIAGIDATLARVDAALGGFQGGSAASMDMPDFLEPQDQELWEYYTPEERETILRNYSQ